METPGGERYPLADAILETFLVEWKLEGDVELMFGGDP